MVLESICGSVASFVVWSVTSHRLLHKQGGWVLLSLRLFVAQAPPLSDSILPSPGRPEQF